MKFNILFNSLSFYLTHILFFLFIFGFLFLFTFPQDAMATVARTITPLDSDGKSASPSQAFSYFAKTHRLSLEDYTEIRAQVKRGQTLSKLLKPHGLTHANIFTAAKAAKRVFDVRKIRSGRWYSIIRMRGGDKALRYFIYEKSPKNYVVFDFDATITVYLGNNKTQLKSRYVQGEMATTLQDLFADLHVPEKITAQFQRVLGNRVNFKNLKKGDRMQVIYDEKYLLGNPVGTGNLTAALVATDTGRYQAFRYTVNGRDGYYDEHGNSLEKSFLKDALKYRKITSGFSNRRFHPVKKRYQSHPGIDYAAPRGTPVKSVGDGIVIFKGYCRSAGNYMKIEHPGVGISEYLHFSKFHPSIKKGKKVSKGDVIGYVGSTGYATGPHLDLRFMINGRYVDYSKLKLPDGAPIAKSEIPSFLEHVSLVASRWHEPTTMVSMKQTSGDDYDPLDALINFPLKESPKASDQDLFSPFAPSALGTGFRDMSFYDTVR